MNTMIPTRNDLPESTRKAVVPLLNDSLALLADLYSQTKQAHWNVKGAQFIALHKLFDELAEGLEGSLDDVAERIVALGGVALGTVRQAAAASRLPEFPTEASGDLAYVEALVERFALAAQTHRAAIEETAKLGDAGTSDLFTGISRELDKSLWFLEAHLRR